MLSTINDLRDIIRDPKRVCTDFDILGQHSGDKTSYHINCMPDVVVFPKDKNELKLIVEYANQVKCPIVPYGLGTSVEGQVIPIYGGICIDFTKMNSILEVRPNDFIVRVESGVTRLQLNQQLKKYGLFFPVDPGIDATIGGMVSTNASGCSALRYGTTREQVLGIEAVLADGTLIRTGSMARKSSSGYNLTQLLAGSEGTLALFSEITLRVHVIPETLLYGKLVFSDLNQACRVANKILVQGINPSKLELVDEFTIHAINKYMNTGYIERPTLFLELSGWKQAVIAELDLINRIISDEDFYEWDYTFDKEKGNQMWDARRQVAFAVSALSPGKRLMTTDVCIPFSSIPEAIIYTRKAMHDDNLEGAILGHIGDGNYHAVFPVDPTSIDEVHKAERVNEKIVNFALNHGGTCTGEHGIGLGKRRYMQKEHGNSYEIMRQIKNIFDPKGLFNPGKVL